MDSQRRRRLAAAILAVRATQEDNSDNTAVQSLLSLYSTALVMLSSSDDRRGTPGRVWSRRKNSPTWFFDFAVKRDFMGCASWRSLFRITYALFQRLSIGLRAIIEANDSKFRKALPAEIKVAAFLLYAGGCTCEKAATHLGIGPSTVSASVKAISQAITATYNEAVHFPTEEEDVARAMQGFKRLTGLPYCVGAIDGTHIKWPSCPEEQYYEYRCYKGYPSIVLFAVVTTNRRFTYVDIGKPGVLGDSTIFEQSTLKRNIENGTWMGEEIPDLVIANIAVL